MTRSPQMTGPTIKVLAALCANPGLSGAEISRSTKLASGTLYPLLLRLEKAGWLSSHWEVGDPATLGRPRRRFYRLTGEGQIVARDMAEGLQSTIGGLVWN